LLALAKPFLCPWSESIFSHWSTRIPEFLVYGYGMVSRLVALMFCLVVGLFPACAQEEAKGAPAEPDNAGELRARIASVEQLMSKLPDRGAALFFLAVRKQRLGATREAIELLKECVALQEGFDPSGEPAFSGLRGTKEFDALVERVHRDFPVVAQAHQAFITQEKDLVPEGLAYDSAQNLFYLSSLNRRKIIQIDAESRTSDFVPGDQYHLLPILGIRLDPNDGSVWANSFDENRGTAELLHFDVPGKLLGRFSTPFPGPHQFNDLVVRKNGELMLTDTFSNQVYRFSPASKTFTPLGVHRTLFYPNGIALTDDDRTLYVADALGVIAVDLAGGASSDVNPGLRSTVAGIDGLYWHNGSLVAIQNDIGSPRIAAFRLSKDGSRVTQTIVLENRTVFTVLPTTGAIRGSDFYFIANSQIDNLNGDHVMDVTKLEPIRIGVVRLP
jgi:hypothetical protein